MISKLSPSMPAYSSSMPDPCRWDTVSAAREFGLTKETLARKLRQAGEVPGSDKRYSTQQLIASLYGNIHGERLRKTAAEADNWELKNDVLRGESLPKGLLTPALEQIFVIIKQLIQASSMTTPEKRDLLNTIATWPVAVRTVATKAAKQVKLERGEGENGNGDHGDD